MRGAMDEGLERLGRVQEVEGDEAMPQAVEQVDTANTYVVESTGARVFLHTAVQMLNNLCATMHDDWCAGMHAERLICCIRPNACVKVVMCFVIAE